MGAKKSKQHASSKRHTSSSPIARNSHCIRGNRAANRGKLRANQGANQGKSRANGDAVPLSQAAQILGVDPSTVKRMCTSGKLASFKTAGGHWRIQLAAIEAIQRGDTDTNNGAFPVSSSLAHRRERVKELELRYQETKAQMNLDELEDEARKTKAQKAAAQAAQEIARSQSRHSDDERQQQELKRRWDWIEVTIEEALSTLPPHIPRHLVPGIELAIEDVLQTLDPDSPPPRVERLVRNAIDNVIQPWEQERQQQRKANISRAVSDATNWLYLPPGILGNRELQNEVNAAALQAIITLPEYAMVHDQMVIAGRAAAQKAVRVHNQQQDNELARQREAEREGETNRYLSWYVKPYLEELQRAPTGGYDFHGELSECAAEIEAAIKQGLLDDKDLNPYNARHRVRDAVDRWLNANVKDEEAATGE